MKHTISACLVVFNEEKVIERCLRSIQPVVDEIVIVHDGECSDRTLEIARQYGTKVFVEEHLGSSESHRVTSYEKATGEWILQIDADEFLSPELAAQIPVLAQNGEVDAYAFAWPAFNGRDYYAGPFSMSARLCLFRRDQLYFVAITHSAPRTYGRVANRLDLMLEHRPQYNNNTFSKLRRKFFRWSRLQAKQILLLAEAQTFHVSDLTATEEFQYYTKLIRHPFIRGGVQAMRLWQRSLVYYVSHPRDMLIWDNTKSLLILSINTLYLAWQVARLKPDYRENVMNLFKLGTAHQSIE